MDSVAKLKSEPGLFGVTKLEWKSWPSRNWLSWLLAALFLVGAGILISQTVLQPRQPSSWHSSSRIIVGALLVVIVVVRLVMEATVAKPEPGSPLLGTGN